MKINNFKAFALAGVLVLAACQSVQTTQPGVVGVDRKQSMFLSADEVNKGAVTAYRDELKKAQAKGALNSNAAYTARVRAIAQRLIPATGAFRQDAPGWAWETNVITSADVNAWCMPGGKIAVYTGLIEKLKITDDELAAVMGHEIAHALREHGREQASQQAVQSGLISIGGALLGVGDLGQQLAGVVADVTFNLPHSRQDETEADRIGVELAARSGYDPHAAITLWQKMMKLGGSQPPQILSTHPSNQARLDDLKVYDDRVAPLYQTAKK